MTPQEKYDEIHASMINGQINEAVQQMKDMGLHNMPSLLDYIHTELGEPVMALAMAKTFFRLTYR